jgi:adenylyl-sulfate kinase
LQEQQERRRQSQQSGGMHPTENDEDKLIQERMPMCVGICVLLAIVYVLSRTGVDQSTLPQQDHAALRHEINAVVPVSTQTVPATTPVSQKYTENYRTPAVTAVVANPQEGPSCSCGAEHTESDTELMGRLRQQALANTPPHIIECAAAEDGQSQSACHLPKRQRFAALGQKGATLWMTGCSGAGKTTIATALEDLLVKQYGKHVYRLDGDNLRTGLNRDLGFSEWDRAESVRRTGELATLFSDSGVITLVGLISPYRKDRDEVRKRHEEQGIPFYEVFLDVPVEELFSRDPKGQYARVKSGELKHFTCIDDPYEEPLQPEIVLKTHECEFHGSLYTT